MKNLKKCYKRERFNKEVAIKLIEQDALEELKAILTYSNISYEAI